MRCDGKMSYKDFIFPVNPRTITIRTDRHVALSAVPGGSDVVSDLGSGARIVSGEGEFFGEGAVQSFLRLRQVMNSGGGGMLYIPSQSPIFAVAKKLVFDAVDAEGVVHYSFEFVESFDKSRGGSAAALYGDGKKTLWDISYESRVNINVLVQKNRHIRRPDVPVMPWERVVLC